MSKLPEDLTRFLFLVPFVAARRDGVPADELAEMLSTTTTELGRLLDRVAMVGAPDGGPDEMVEVYLEGGRVFVALSQRFTRPPRFSVEEMAALLLALAPLNGLPQLQHKAQRLSDRLVELASERAEALAPDFRRRLVVRADGQEDPRHLQVLEQAFEEKRYVDARYYTAGRDAVSDRRIAPCGLIQVRGTWYVAAAEGKVFKVGRFERVTLSDERFDVAPVPLGELRRRLERMDFGGHEVHLKIDGEDRHIPSFTSHMLRHYVRTHRGRAEVVTPLKARQELIEETQAILDRYL